VTENFETIATPGCLVWKPSGKKWRRAFSWLRTESFERDKRTKVRYIAYSGITGTANEASGFSRLEYSAHSFFLIFPQAASLRAVP